MMSGLHLSGSMWCRWPSARIDSWTFVRTIRISMAAVWSLGSPISVMLCVDRTASVLFSSG